jgi:hypothetical protein
MTVIIEAPYPATVTGLILPNPELDNTESRNISVNHELAMDGTRYTYVKTSARKLLSYTWESIGRGKLVEVQEFYKLYAGERIKVTDFKGNVWDALFQNAPTITTTKLSVNAGAARKESGALTLEFLGAQIA